MEQEAGNQMLTVLNSIENEYTALRNRFIELVQNNKGKDTSSEQKVHDFVQIIFSKNRVCWNSI